MEKRIPVTIVAFAVSTLLHVKRLAAAGDNKLLRYKEILRYESIVADVVIPQKAGDPGENIHYHGCEARGI